MLFTTETKTEISISGPQRFKGKLISADVAREYCVSGAQKQGKYKPGSVRNPPACLGKGKPSSPFPVQETLQSMLCTDSREGCNSHFWADLPAKPGSSLLWSTAPDTGRGKEKALPSHHRGAPGSPLLSGHSQPEEHTAPVWQASPHGLLFQLHALVRDITC